MQSAFYASDDVIVDRSLHSEPALYFIIEGEVIEYYYPNSDVYNSENAITIREKKKGEIVGLYEFVTNSHKAITFSKSRGVTELHFLKHKDFIDIISKFPDEKEHYYTMKDQLMIHNKTKYVEVECSLCYSKEHIDTNCSETFYEQRRRQFNLKYGKIPSKQVINAQRKNTQLRYHSIKEHYKIEQEISKYRLVQLQIDQEQEQYLLEQTQIEQNQIGQQSIQLDEKNKAINIIQTNVNKNTKKKNREQKILTMMSQYNSDQMHDLQNQFIMNYLSPSSNSYDGNQEIILIDPSDQDCNNADSQELNLVKHSFQQLDSPNFKQNHIQKSKNKNLMSPKESSNYLNKKDYVGSEDEDFEPENTSSSIQTFVPSNIFNAYAKLDDQKNDTDVRATSSSTNQQVTPQLKYQLQKSNSNSMNLTYAEDTNKSINNLAIPNQKQRQFKRSQFSCDDNIINLNKNMSNNSKDIININGNNQNNNLKIHHPIVNGYFNQNQKNQINNNKLNNIMNNNSQVYTSQFQSTLQIQELKKEASNISDRNFSQKQTLNMITERSVCILEKQRDEEDCVSIDYSAVRNFKIYFPHNNISAITNKNKQFKNQRSLLNPLLRSKKYDKKTTTK